jgi:hypothetical protein
MGAVLMTYLPASLCVNNKPPYLSCVTVSKRVKQVATVGISFTSRLLQGCLPLNAPRWPPGFLRDQTAGVFPEAAQHHEAQKAAQKCTLIGGVAVFNSKSAIRDGTMWHPPTGSSLVENQMTLVGFGVSGLALKTDKIALKPCVRGWATPNTFMLLPRRGARKLGAP